VCQVAGTLHAAAFYAGLTVEEYHAHSRLNRFAYLQPGLDAMVAWPEQVRELRDTKDLRLRNPYPFPVLIRTGVIAAGQQKSLRVQLFGSAPPFRVEFQFAVLERVPEGEIRRADDALGVGVTEVQQEGMEGLVIARRRTIYTPGGAVFEERRVAYPSTPRILRVGTRPPPVLDLPMAAR
jgi:vancomycin resistance protein YoaR